MKADKSVQNANTRNISIESLSISKLLESIADLQQEIGTQRVDSGNLKWIKIKEVFGQNIYFYHN